MKNTLSLLCDTPKDRDNFIFIYTCWKIYPLQALDKLLK
ncbi:hypothetical protein COO91_06198 [Nostoc flagelliforme CCNUN1]|uniref:Uncharacterized protein n=1 Tax=Nostoc flagelliforme CCNUN1 TaxID=2038116 RepID=A0A2K8SXN7_9NOSO|nr:hypothetical protein COO91_06198 [Nostoc flagelliforme CCNUN1]